VQVNTRREEEITTREETMPATGLDGPCRDKELQDLEKLKTLIGSHVLRAIGGAGGKGLVQVRPLWDGYYRVNLVVGDGPGCVTIPRSYFLRTDGAGNVLESTPKLTKRD
jgi:hypothetical protein